MYYNKHSIYIINLLEGAQIPAVVHIESSESIEMIDYPLINVHGRSHLLRSQQRNLTDVGIFSVGEAAGENADASSAPSLQPLLIDWKERSIRRRCSAEVPTAGVLTRSPENCAEHAHLHSGCQRCLLRWTPGPRGPERCSRTAPPSGTGWYGCRGGVLSKTQNDGRYVVIAP